MNNTPIYRAKKIGSDEYVEGDLFNKKYIILESELNKEIVVAIEHIDEVLVSQCSTECKNEHNALDDAEWNYGFYKYLSVKECDDEEEICGYYCLACGNIQEHGDYCDRCNAIALDPMYF